MKDSDVTRTYPSKGLIIFLSAVLLLSTLVIIGVMFLVDIMALKIVLIIFCSIFIVLSIIVLIGEAFNYLSVDKENKCLIIHKFITKKKVPLNELSRIENKDGFYIFSKGKKELYRIGTNVTGVNTLIIELERCGINIKW